MAASLIVIKEAVQVRWTVQRHVGCCAAIKKKAEGSALGPGCVPEAGLGEAAPPPPPPYLQASLCAMGPCMQPLPTCSFQRCNIEEDGKHSVALPFFSYLPLLP